MIYNLYFTMLKKFLEAYKGINKTVWIFTVVFPPPVGVSCKGLLRY